MIGHEPLKSLRMRGIKPAAVWIADYPSQISMDWHAPFTLSGLPMEKHNPSISIEATDRLNDLDLRFLVGLEVYTSSSNECRAKALFDACKRSGAVLVVGCHTQDGKHYADQTGWIEIYKKESNG